MQQNPYRIEDVSLVGRVPPDRVRGRKQLYPWDQLQVGQSFFVAFDEGAPTHRTLERRLRNALSWAKRKGKIKSSQQHAFVPHPEKKPTGLMAGRIK